MEKDDDEAEFGLILSLSEKSKPDNVTLWKKKQLF